MPKYRIVKNTSKAHTTTYAIQFRCCWIWCNSDTKYNTYQEAKESFDGKMKHALENTIVKTEVVFK